MTHRLNGSGYGRQGSYASDIVGPQISLGALWVRAHLRITQASQRSVGEPAEGSLLREALRAPGGLGPQLFTLCVPTFVVALADLGGPPPHWLPGR